MTRVSTVLAAGAATLILCQPALAVSDIAIAAITTGRLYVVGNTERPHTPVMLDDQFRTESDDTGKFQYELVYHPARCIVSALIDGKTYEAVVSGCAQQCQVSAPERVPTPGAAIPPTLATPPDNAPQPTGMPASAEVTKPARQSDSGVSSSATLPQVAPSEKDPRARGAGPRSLNAVPHPLQPPRPPQKAAVPSRSARPVRPPQPPKPAPQPEPDDQEAMPED